MKVISPGRWVEEALQLSMTKAEYTQWFTDRVHEAYPVLRVPGKNSVMHYVSINGQKIIVYELNEEAARLEQMEAVPVA